MSGIDRCFMCGKEYETGCVRQFPFLCEDCRENEGIWEKAASNASKIDPGGKKAMDLIEKMLGEIDEYPVVPGKFIGWTARAFEKEEEKPESEVPPTKKTYQVNENGFEGCYCAKCKEFYPYAEPNMDDGTLVCYSCRNQ